MLNKHQEGSIGIEDQTNDGNNFWEMGLYDRLYSPYKGPYNTQQEDVFPNGEPRTLIRTVQCYTDRISGPYNTPRAE